MVNSNNNKTSKESIAAKMKALAAKTIANGCTEAEANIAFEMLQKLQTKYNMTLNEAEIRGEGVAFITFLKPLQMALFTLPGIKTLADVSPVYDESSNAVLFFGNKHDIEYAHYLFAIVNGALIREWNNFILTKEYSSLRKSKHNSDYIKSSFHAGIGQRLLNRLLTMAKENETISMSNGKELVILKESMQKEAMGRVGIETMEISKEIKANAMAYNEGDKAGAKISLSRGISTSKVSGYLG